LMITARHWSLSWARCIQSTPSHPTSLTSIRYTPSSSEWSLPFRFSDKNMLCISSFSNSCYMPHPSHPPLFDRPNKVWWSFMQSSPSSSLGPHILLSTLCLSVNWFHKCNTTWWYHEMRARQLRVMYMCH
jgi:hypothetical protein